MKPPMNAGKLLAIGTAITVTLAVSASIWLDPPADIRARMLDAERLDKLYQTKQAVDAYFNREKALPSNLEAIRFENERISPVPLNWRDPVTVEPFGYEITGEKSYRLCAIFDRASDGQYTSWDRAHKAGRDCFEFKVFTPNKP